MTPDSALDRLISEADKREPDPPVEDSAEDAAERPNGNAGPLTAEDAEALIQKEEA